MMSQTTETRQTGARLDYLDGLRGLTALYVVLFHCRSEFTWRYADGGFSPGFRAATEWMNFGHYAVVVFIVLSGYCLMLPIIRSQDQTLAGGLWGFLGRRARRTLPAYYGAVALSLLLIASFPALRQQVGAQWDRCLPAFQTDVLLAHLLMLHNLRFAWSQTIDAPLWSMATEWDIYIVFALLLLPLWRQSGTVVMTGMAILLGLLPHLFLPQGGNFDWACPWFLGCFALGMAGAVVSVPSAADGGRPQTHAAWSGVALFLGICVALICVLCPAWGGLHWADVDMLVAGAAASALVVAAGPHGRGVASVLRCLASRPLRVLGGFSYSLYLIHFPLLALVNVPIWNAGLMPDTACLCLTALTVPLSLLAAAGFSRVFERPFLRRERRLQPAQKTREQSAERKAAERKAA